MVLASTMGHDKVVQLLVDAGANKDWQNNVSYYVMCMVALLLDSF